MPLRLETLGEGDRVLAAMTSWIWVMPKEARGCIGCHEDRELTPPNRFVQAVRKRPHVLGVGKGGEGVGLTGDGRQTAKPIPDGKADSPAGDR